MPASGPSLETLVTTQGERHAEFKRRRDKFLYMKVPIGGEAPYLLDGWQESKKLKKQIRLASEKSIDRQFEDKVWRLFFRMGYDELNRGHNFVIQYKAASGTYRTKQIDIFAKDDETIIVGECKASEDYKSRSLSVQIAEFAGLRKQLADAIRSRYGKDFKPKILWFFFTEKILWSKADREKCEAENIKIMTEREVDYFSQLTEHLGRAAGYQFLAEYLGGQKIPELKGVKVPAIRGRLGGRKFYSFVSTPEQLLKICFVNHRTLKDPLALPTYQRLVNKGRLKSIGKFIVEGGFFPTNILINFDEKRPFDKKQSDELADVQFGDLHLPDKYKSAWIIDGQHRLYGYSLIDPKFGKQNIAVIAFEGLKREEEAELFVTINHEQKTVPRTLLDELDADLKWGSSIPSQRLASIAARVVQTLSESVGEPLFRRVVAQGMKGDDIVCLTMPELKGGIVRSHLIGGLADRRTALVEGPLSAAKDEQTVKRAATGINAFLAKVRDTVSTRWELGRNGGLATNVGVRGLLLLFSALVKHLEDNSRMIGRKLAAEEVALKAAILAKPLFEHLKVMSDAEFLERFSRKYGSGGPLEYFYELAEILHKSEPDFQPDGLTDYIASKDDERIRTADDTLTFIETRATDIVVSYFKALHGNKYWNYIGTSEMRVKAYQRQQDYEPEKQLALEFYLDFIDKKKIVEKPENWTYFQKYFDIPLSQEKGRAKNLKWMEKLNELRKIKAHPAGRFYRPEDLDFLDWVRGAFEQKLLAADGQESVSREAMRESA